MFSPDKMSAGPSAASVSRCFLRRRRRRPTTRVAASSRAHRVPVPAGLAQAGSGARLWDGMVERAGHGLGKLDELRKKTYGGVPVHGHNAEDIDNVPGRVLARPRPEIVRRCRACVNGTRLHEEKTARLAFVGEWCRRLDLHGGCVSEADLFADYGDV